MSTLEPQLKARPTEYCGVRFRSKSEAIFARVLDIGGYFWEYEPKIFCSSEWKPDFWVIHQHRHPKKEIASILLEYKPRRPTETYLEQLSVKAMPASQLGHQVWLIACSPFNDDDPRLFALEEDGSWSRPNNGGPFIKSEFFEAAQYRFDLTQG